MILSRSLVLAIVIIALAGCQQGGPPEVVGDKATLPSNCALAKEAHKYGETYPGFYKFDGQYPDGWPPEITIPEGSFLKENGQIKARLGSEFNPQIANSIGEYTMYSVLALVDKPNQQIIDHFKQELDSLGWKYEGRESTDRQLGVDEYIIACYPYQDDKSSPYFTVTFRTTKFKDLGGWTFYGFAITVKQ